MTTQPLIEQAMALPLEERIVLAEALWQSIDEGLRAGSERDAIAHAVQRDAELVSGNVAGCSHEQVMQAACTGLNP